MFELLTDFKIDYLPITVRKWRSSRSGMEVTWLDQPSPFINAFVCVRTEPLDNSGWLHALTKMISSEKLFNWKKNAFCTSPITSFDRDNYEYFVTSVGWQSFKTVLPLALNHVLHPNLSDSAFSRAVHDIDRNNRDTGDTYDEVKKAQNRAWPLEKVTSCRLLYDPTAYCHFNEWGTIRGIANLTPELLRERHKEFFRADNLGIVVMGHCDEEELLEMLEEYDKTMPECELGGRIFEDAQYLPLSSTVVKTVYYPASTETQKDAPGCLVSARWIGPEGKASALYVAASVLAEYLNTVFKKSKLFVSNYVRKEFCFKFSHIPAEEVDDVPDLIVSLVRKVEIDVAQLRQLVQKNRRSFVFESERNRYPITEENVVKTALHEFKYGDSSGSDLQSWLKSLKHFDTLLQWGAEEWETTFTRCFKTSKPCIMVVKPSVTLYLKSASLEQLSTPGRKKFTRMVKRVCSMKIQIKPRELKSSAAPNPSMINFIHNSSIGVGLNKAIVNDFTCHSEERLINEAEGLRLYVQMENIVSNFAHINLFLSVFEIEESLLPYIPILVKLYQTFPTKDSTAYGIMVVCHEFIDMGLMVPIDEYNTAVHQLYDFLYNVSFSRNQVLYALKSLKESNECRSLSAKWFAARNQILFTPRSLNRIKGVTTEFLEDLIEGVNESFGPLYRALNQARAQLFRSRNMRVVLALDFDKVKDPLDSWKMFPERGRDPQPLVPFDSIPRKIVRAGDGRLLDSGRCFMLYLNNSMVFPALYTFNADVDVFKWVLALECLNDSSGPFNRAIEDFATVDDEVTTAQNIETGILTLNLNCREYAKCYKTIKKVVSQLASGSKLISGKLRRKVIAKLVVEDVSQQENYAMAATRKAFDMVLSGRGEYFSEKMFDAFSNITSKDLVSVFKQYYDKLFDAERSVCLVSCSEENGQEVTRFFTEIGYNVGGTPLY